MDDWLKAKVKNGRVGSESREGRSKRKRLSKLDDPDFTNNVVLAITECMIEKKENYSTLEPLTDNTVDGRDVKNSSNMSMKMINRSPRNKHKHM